MSGQPVKKKRSSNSSKKAKKTFVAERAFKVTPLVKPTKGDGDESSSSSSVDAEDVQFFEENRGFSGEKKRFTRPAFVFDRENADEATKLFFFFFFFFSLCSVSNTSNRLFGVVGCVVAATDCERRTQNQSDSRRAR
jgi:hypothetical protein